MDEPWLRTGESQDVAASIRHCLASLDLTPSDPHAFKWVLLSLHSALQGACVCHLTTTFVPLGAVTKKNKMEWINWSEDHRTNPAIHPPATMMANLPELLKRIRKLNSVGDGSTSDGIALSDTEYEWLTRIHTEIRNEFTHFAPKEWLINLTGVPDLIQLTVRLIRDIVTVGSAFRDTDAVWKAKFTKNLDSLEAAAIRLVAPT